MRAFLGSLAFLFSIIAASGAEADTSRLFDGVWESCESSTGEQICEYYVLKQKEGRICGLWHYWSSRHSYDGRLIADAEGLSGRVNYTCGTPGSETRTPCSAKAVPFAASEWTKTDKPILICDKRLYELSGGERSCADIGKSPGLPKLSSFSQPKLSQEDRDWMIGCLNDPAYPPPALRK
ncbi:MAG: hypothetical protein JOY67_00570 [Hyphomicrobiales bacterium]|nr:hypothetical protein [Hyphomicrobiales bacterium]MBV9518835.1 hypothetical protein [Hyphomicrobiales bacterium]